uniref:Leucine-rich repeat-containing N-terminal plant-type domain-containing protein n=3 Tax=Aegilops tauschii subsp. strangulata TaxID=200361 RepID=A0A453G5X2_AEGTS
MVGWWLLPWLARSTCDAGIDKLLDSAEHSCCLFHSSFVMADNTKFVLFFLLLSSSSPCFGTEQDIGCLKSVQGSLADPGGVLRSWDFENDIDGYICRFTGVECWHPDQNRVLGLRLGNLGLEGPFPPGLQLCSFMTALDMSGNNFSGPLPEHIFEQMAYITYLDLSNNSFSGVIPAGIGNMMYLSTLALFSTTSSPAEFRRSWATLRSSFRSMSPITHCRALSRTLCSASRLPTSRATQGFAGRRSTRSARRGSGCGYAFGLSGFGRCLSGFRRYRTGSTTRPSSGRRLGSSLGSWWPSTSRTNSCSVRGSSPTPFVCVGDAGYTSIGLENAPAAFVGLFSG